MRYLVPLTALALVIGCGDATSPTSGATPADPIAESNSPNLRRARESLIHAGNAVSAAIADDGVAGGLAGALAANAILLSPRMPAIRGRDEVAAFLSGDPLAPSALSWEVIVADVSADATQGYTWAQGSSTFDLGTGATSFPSYFLAYWRRAESGKWKIAAFVVNRGGPEPLPLPDGFGTPNRREGSSFPPSGEQELRRQLLSTDRAFSAFSVQHGSGPAFERFAAPKAIAVGETFIFGPEAIGQAFTGGPDDVVSWAPRFVDAASSADLGFTVGDAVFELAGIPPFYTKYLTVWQRRTNGQWRFIADFGNSRPAPAP
jgi:ketosteroid isomerase-like protein